MQQVLVSWYQHVFCEQGAQTVVPVLLLVPPVRPYFELMVPERSRFQVMQHYLRGLNYQ